MTTEARDPETLELIQNLEARLAVLEQRVWELEIELGGRGADAGTADNSPPPVELQSVEVEDPADAAAQGDEYADEAATSFDIDPVSAGEADEGGAGTELAVRDEPGADEPASRDPFEVIEVDARISGDSDDGVDYVWKVTLQSHADRKQRLQARIHFVDAHSLLVEEVVVRGLALYAGQRQLFTGKVQLETHKADDVAGVKAHISADS